MNNYYELLRELLVIYGATTLSSMICNGIYYNKRIKKSFEDSKRKLKYKELCSASNEELKNVKRFCDYEKRMAMLFSSIPFYQLVFTINNILLDQKAFDEFFDKRIDCVNTIELLARKKFLREIKKSNDIPKDIEEKLKDKEYLPNEDEFLEVIVYRGIKKLNLENYKDIR